MQAVSDSSLGPLGPVHQPFHNPNAESGGPASFSFEAGSPQSADYFRLAQHIESSMESGTNDNAFLHPALASQADTVVAALRRMADQPEAEANLRAYHSLRLLVP